MAVWKIIISGAVVMEHMENRYYDMLKGSTRRFDKMLC